MENSPRDMLSRKQHDMKTGRTYDCSQAVGNLGVLDGKLKEEK